MSPAIIIIAAFIGVATLVGGVAMLLRGNADERLEGRLDQLTGRGTNVSSDTLFKTGSLIDAFSVGQGFFEQLLARYGRLSLLFDQADTSLTAARFFLISGVMAAAGMAASQVAGFHPSVLPVGAIAFGIVPLGWLMFRRGRRLKKFASQLPDSLELIARALRAGHSLAAGFDLVGTEISDPLGKEFSRVFDEQNLGIPIDEALEAMTERIPNLDLKFFATALVLQKQTGGDLASILDKIGNLIRERYRILGQVQALTGEGRLSGVVLLALPPVLMLAVYRLNPGYLEVLFTDPTGNKMLLVATVMQIVGALVIRKIVNIKV